MGMYSDWSNWLYLYHYAWQTKPRTERLGCHRSLFVIQEEYLRKITFPLYQLSIQWNLLGFATIAINEITPG